MTFANNLKDLNGEVLEGYRYEAKSQRQFDFRPLGAEANLKWIGLAVHPYIAT
jgi:hypothetical protein